MLIKRRKLHAEGKANTVSVIDFTESSRASQLEVQRAKQEAKAIREEAQNILIDSQKKLKEAEANARQIIQDANLEAKRIKDKVYKETLLAAKEEVDYLKDEAKGLLQELFMVKREALTQAHKEIIKVGLDLAEKIIKYQANIDPEILKRQVVEAIKRATAEADRVQVFVNPADIKNLETSIPEMKKLFPSGIDVVSLTNDSVDPGSCIVETKSGQLDASFSTQLKTLTDLTSHLEVKEPEFEIEGEDVLLSEKEEELLVNKETENLALPELEKIEPEVEWEEDEDTENEENVFTQEEEKLKEELLGNEPLIQLPQDEEVFPFTQEDAINEENELPKSEIIEVPEEFREKIEQGKKKKLDLGNLLERTKEEKEELDEDFNYEEEDILEEETKPRSVLKPKKQIKDGEYSKIAKELEENPEWKNLVEDEE